MIEKYSVVKEKNKKYRYYKGVPYIPNRNFKNLKSNSLVGVTKLQKNKKMASHQYLYYKNTSYIIKDKMIGLNKGYIDIGNHNYLILKNNKILVLILIFISILFSLFINQSHNIIHNQKNNNEQPEINQSLIIQEGENNKSPTSNYESNNTMKVNNKTYQKKPNFVNYKIHFHANGGFGIMNTIQTHNEKNIILSKNTFQRLGYHFLGWSTQKDGQPIYKDKEKISISHFSNQETTTLYAIWGINIYSISYQLNGGILEALINNYNINSKDIYIENPLKVGYTFLGWTENEKKGLKKDYVIKQGRYENLNLSANYIPNQYRITFHTNGGMQTYNDKIISYHDTYGTLPVPTKKGYTFLGWKNEFGQRINENTIFENTTDIILYAEWKANTYTVKLNPNGGNVSVDSLVVTYNNKYKYLPTPTKLGYTFDGWYYKGILVDNDTVIDRDFNHELYAQWKINTYTVTYLHPNNTIYATKNITYFSTVPNINYNVDSYHVFNGWYDMNGNSIINKRITSNLTVKANIREVNCYLITGQAQDHDTSRITRFEQLLSHKNLGGKWLMENGYYSFVSNLSNYSHIKSASNYLLTNAASTNWPYLVWLGMFCDNGHSEQLR